MGRRGFVEPLTRYEGGIKFGVISVSGGLYGVWRLGGEVWWA